MSGHDCWSRFAGEYQSWPAPFQKISMSWHPWAPRSKHQPAASLIRPIWRIFKGLEAADMVSWPQMPWLLVQICCWLPNFQPAAFKKSAWPGTHWPPGASTTLQHHSSDPYGGYSRVWRQLAWFHDHKCHDFWSRFANECQTISASHHPKVGMAWHPWAIISQHHSSASLIISIWRIFKGLEAAGMVSWPQMPWFLVQICYEWQTFSQLQSKN